MGKDHEENVIKYQTIFQDLDQKIKQQEKQENFEELYHQSQKEIDSLEEHVILLEIEMK